MNLETNSLTEKGSLRYHKDADSDIFYFSIVDSIDFLELSKDPRNYWKVLKNRLNKTYKELVTECNQLKLKSSDGKYYLTDVASGDTILKIVDLIAPAKISSMHQFLKKIELENQTNLQNNEETLQKISTGSTESYEMKIDIYKKSDSLFITTMAPAVPPQNIFLSLKYKNLLIKFNREKQNISDENYNLQELKWGRFERNIPLPFEVDIDKTEASLSHGILSIKLTILDKERIKIIKVK